MTDPDIAKIAAGLTEAQRRTMTELQDDYLVWSYERTMAVLERKGLAHNRLHGSGWAEFTPLGLAVRRHLQEQSHD